MDAAENTRSTPRWAPEGLASPRTEEHGSWLALLAGWLLASTALAALRTGAGGAETRRPTLDLRAASPLELEALPGIGPVLAARIADRRFEVGADRLSLREVYGIGPRTEARVRAALGLPPVRSRDSAGAP